MQFLLLLFLALACLPEEWYEPWGPLAVPGRSAALTWGGVAFVAGLAWAVSFEVRRRLIADPDSSDAVHHRYSQWRLYHALAQMGVYALSLYAFGWGWAVQRYAGAGEAQAFGAELLTLAPVLAALVLSWAAFYDADRALRDGVDSDDPTWTRGAYVLYHARQTLALVLVPILLLVAMNGVRRALPNTDEQSVTFGSLAGLALPIAVFLFMPYILRLVLGLESLPPGPMRDRLIAAARRLNFRCSDILVWKTRNAVTNAMVAGILPQVRYVLLTDRLMADLTPDEVEAVFGHEVGHVKHHHMLYYLGFLNLSLGVLVALWCLLVPYVPLLRDLGNTLQALPMFTVLGAYIFLVFGFLSRRCERQADVYGCRAVSCGRADCAGHDADAALVPGGRGLCPTGIRTFIEALEKVARLNGISRDRPGWLQSWQHSTIARRVEFLQGVLAEPGLERRFQRRVALVKWGLFVGLAAALLALIVLTLEQSREPVAADASVRRR